MKKKLGLGLGIVALVALTVFGINQLMPKPEVGDKTIQLIVVDETNENEVILDKSFKTDAETLEAFLAEKTELKAEMETGAYGAFLNGMLDLTTTDMNAGPWWLYESENNALCLQAGYCPGVSEVTIYDGDVFTFKWTTSF